MAGAREIQLGEILENLKNKELISINEIDGVVEICYRVLDNLVERTKQRESWKARALKAESELKLVKGGKQ